MGLINRLIGEEDPKIAVHEWPKSFDMWKRNRINVDVIVVAYGLVQLSEDVAQVVTAQNKLGLRVDHPFLDDDWVYLTSTGDIPGGMAPEIDRFGAQSGISQPYYVISSNPAQGTVKLSETKAGIELDLTSEGTGSHMLHRIDPDMEFWDVTRKSISGNDNEQTKELRRFADEMYEGIFEIAEASIAFITEQEAKDEMVAASQWLSRV